MLAWRSAIATRRPQVDGYALIDEAELAIPYLSMSLDDHQLVGGVPEDGLLHAAGILQFLREHAEDDVDRKVQQELEHNAGRYSEIPGLQAFLLAAEAYAHGDWDSAITAATRARIKAAPVIDISAALVLARALEKQQQWSEALSMWRYLHAHSSNDATAMAAGYTLTALLARQPEQLLDTASPLLKEPGIADYAIRRFLSEEQLSAELARSTLSPAAHRTLRDTLMLRRLLRQDWAGFLQLYDAATTAERAPYAEVETAARTLASHPDDPKALLNAGYYLVNHDDRRRALLFCSGTFSIDEELAAASPSGNTRASWDDGYARPASYFRRAIEQHPGGELEAKLLYHGVYCYSQAWAWSCADDSVPQPMRREWFQRLKSEYPNSPWAKKLKYWW